MSYGRAGRRGVEFGEASSGELAGDEDQPPPDTRPRSRSVTEDVQPPPANRPVRSALAQTAAPIVDLRKWLRAIGLEGRTNTLAKALQVAPDGEPITSELRDKTDSALDAAAVQAGLLLFERKRLVNAVEQCRNDQPGGAAFPPSKGRKQSVRRILKKSKLEEYHDALVDEHGLGWGDLSWATLNDLEEAGMKEFHAKRLLRYIKKEVKFCPVDEEGIPPVSSAPTPWTAPVVEEGEEVAEDEDEEDVPSTYIGPKMPGANPDPDPDPDPEPEPDPDPEPEPEPEPDPDPDDVALDARQGSQETLSARLRTKTGFVEPDELKPENLEMTDELLGEGQYGKVYGGVLLSYGKNDELSCGKRQSVAVKVMGQVNTADVAEYEKEIAVLRKVSSTCSRVCRLYGTCVKNGSHCIVMKRYRSSLATFLREQPDGKMSPELTMDYAVQISQSLAELHAGRVVVNDLKPDNVLIDEHCEAYLADFGISKIVSSTASIQQNTNMKGTFQYMSPESFNPDQAKSFPTDMWSLGCTLVELLTGVAPWAGLQHQQIVFTVCVNRRVPALPADGHPGLCALIEKCFSFEPQDRPTSQQFYEAATRLLHSQLRQQSQTPGSRMPFTQKEKLLLHWIKQDTDLCNEQDDAQAVKQAAQQLDVDSSVLQKSNSEVLAHLEAAIIKATLKLEHDKLNPFQRGMFLSHYQVTGGPEVMLLKKLISQACPRLKGKLWFDKDQEPTTEQMRLGVKRCKYFVLFLSRGVLLRPFVRMEIRWALYYKKQIRLVWPQEGQHAVTRFQDFFDDCARAVPGAFRCGVSCEVCEAGGECTEAAENPQARKAQWVPHRNTDVDDIDIRVIFSDNVAIPYYKDPMFRNASLSTLLKQCNFGDEAAKLQAPPATILPEGLKVQLQYNMLNGRDQAEYVKLELEEMQLSLVRCCSTDVRQPLDSEQGHLLIYVTQDVFRQQQVIAAVRRAIEYSRPITCLVETQAVHGGFDCTEYNTLPTEAMRGAPADISATDSALLKCKVVPFYKDKDFRNISLQVVVQSMQSEHSGLPLTRERSPVEGIHGGNSKVRRGDVPGGGYGTCLDREFVQMEAGQAMDHGKNIITVFEDDNRMAGFFDYDLAKVKYEGTRWVDLLHLDATVYRRDKWEADAMISKIIDKAAGQTCSTKRNPLNAPGIWDFFLCHAQGTASDQVKVVAEMLRKRGKTVWLDMEMQNRGTDAMMEGVAHCKSFVLFLTGDKGLFEPATSPKRTGTRDGSGSDALADWNAKYKQQAELGTDRVSTVYHALDTKLHREVAMKVFRPPTGSTFDEAQSRALERASVIGSRVMHTNIAACYDYLMSPDSSHFFQALELCEGPTLQYLFDEHGPMREATAVGYLSAVCDGLDAMHIKDVVHQYITLSNIKLSHGVPKILNFQLARAPSVAASAAEHEPELGTLMLTDRTSEVAGSPDYKSPEAWRGDGHVDSRTDIWSVGVCLFVLLTGKMPFVVPEGMDTKHLVGEVLYKMDPAPDVRDTITETHSQEMDNRRPWQVSDATAAVVSACLEKQVSSRPRSARVLKTQLDEAMAEGGALEYDIVLSYAQPDESAALQIHAQLQDVLRHPVGPNKERLAVHLVGLEHENDDSVGRSTCFIPVISTATLQCMSAQTIDASARSLLARCQLATNLSKLGLLQIVPVLCGDDAGSDFVSGSSASDRPAIQATVAEMISSLKRSARLRATNLQAGNVSFDELVSLLLESPAAIRMREEDSEDSCAAKLVAQVGTQKKVVAARKHRGLHSSMVGVTSGRDQVDATDVEAAGELDLYSDGSESLTPLLPNVVPVVAEDIRDRVNYTDASVRTQLKFFSWFTKIVAIALKMPPGVERDLARAKVLHHTQSTPALKCLSVGVERLMSGLPTDLHSIVAGLDEPPIALVVDILDRAALPLSQIESAQTHRSPERYEAFFDERHKAFYVIALLARTTDTAIDSLLEKSARKFVLDTFVPVAESEQFQIRSGIQAILAGTQDETALERGVDSSTGKLLYLVLQLVKVVGDAYPVPFQQPVADSPLFVLIAHLAQAGIGTDQWRLEMQTQLESLLHEDTLVQVARSCWTGKIGSAEDPYEMAIAHQMSRNPEARATEAGRLVLFLEVQCSECTAAPCASGAEVSPAVQDLFEARKAEFRRIAQLAVPAVAAATEPRFCAGGYIQEREHAATHILKPLEEAGWHLLRPMRLLWAGGRDPDELAKGCDANTRALISKVLEAVAERPPDRTRPDEIEDMSESVQEALGKMLVELQVAARLAVEPPSADRERGRARLLEHVQKRFEAQQVQLYTPISRIFDGATDAQSLCSGLDHIDAAAVRKILFYIGNREECLAPSWPRWEVLFGTESEPRKQTKDLIARREVEWKRIAQLAVPAVALATYPRFCSGGIEVEKDTVMMELIDDLERRGWCIREGIKRIWGGERDIHVVAREADIQDTHILRHILSLVVETPDKVVRSAERERQARRALAECDNALRVAARLATAPASHSRQSDRDRLMAHIYDALEPRGLELGYPISRILSGEREESRLTEDLDDIDTECTQKCLDYVRMIEQQGVSTDLWPTVDVLSQAPPNTQRFIDKCVRDGSFDRIIRATTPTERRDATTFLLDRWEENGWEVRLPVQRLWDGERREHAVVGTSDRNSRHVVRKLLSMFEASERGEFRTSLESEARSSYGGSDYGSSDADSSISEAKVQQIMLFTSCTAEQARTCLEAADGDVEQAAALAMDAVEQHQH